MIFSSPKHGFNSQHIKTLFLIFIIEVAYLDDDHLLGEENVTYKNEFSI